MITNEHNFFKKNISLSLYCQKGWRWLCVRDELETGTDCYFDPKVFLAIAALLFHLGWVTQPWPSVCRWLSVRYLVSNSLKPSRAPGYIVVSYPLASVVLPLIYTGASLDWRLSRGSICYIYIYIWCFCRYIYFTLKIYRKHFGIVGLQLTSSNSNCVIKFSFRLKSLGKVWIPLPLSSSLDPIVLLLFYKDGFGIE